MSLSAGNESQDIYPTCEMLQHLASAKQWQRLLQMAKERLGQNPDDHTAHRACALAYLHLRQVEDAGLHVTKLLQEDPHLPYHQELAAKAAIGRMDFQQAKSHLEAGLEADPEMGSLHRLMAVVYGALGNLEKSHLHARHSQELEGDTRDSWLAREMAWEADFQDATSMQQQVMALEMALAHAPEHAFTLWRVGRILLRMERVDEAEKWLARALSAEPQNVTYAREWKEARERVHIVYRCLSYPWRSGAAFLRTCRAIKIRPYILVMILKAIPFWLVAVPWWFLSWACLAPSGCVVRYYMLVHPAFDMPLAPRGWFRTLSAHMRSLIMILTLGAMCGLAHAVLPWELFVAWILLSGIQFSAQLLFTRTKIVQAHEKAPVIPAAWLKP